MEQCKYIEHSKVHSNSVHCVHYILLLKVKLHMYGCFTILYVGNFGVEKIGEFDK